MREELKKLRFERDAILKSKNELEKQVVKANKQVAHLAKMVEDMRVSRKRGKNVVGDAKEKSKIKGPAKAEDQQVKEKASCSCGHSQPSRGEVFPPLPREN